MKTPSNYIESFDSNISTRLENINKLILKIAPEINVSIKYDMLYYNLNEKYLYVGAFKKHIGLYGFKETILNYKSSFMSLNDTYYLFNNKDLDINELTSLLTYHLK